MTGHHPIVIVGAGPVGLTLAIDLASRGIPALVLQKHAASEGSRAICHAKRSLEIWNRLGAGEAIRDRGVTWNAGKVFHRDRLLYSFDLQPEKGHKMPAFVNLQQYHVESMLLDRLRALGGTIRAQHACERVQAFDDHVRLGVSAPGGPYELSCEWLIACDGARSTVRRQLGLGFRGEVFAEKFLISDVRMQADFPPERWFWFEPPFHRGQTALLHRQADDVWRIDLQLGPDADVEQERKSERVMPRLRAMLGAAARFELVWTSVYAFQCRTLDRYVHGRVIFAGDAAHQVSPFGARGGNGGVQDADNLGWKLALVHERRAPGSLLDSYDAERLAAARENILHSTRATEFMTPKTQASRVLRDTALALASGCPFARAFINSGRLSVPANLQGSLLNTADQDAFTCDITPGSPAADAPLDSPAGPAWFLDCLAAGFTVLVYQPAAGSPEALAVDGIEVAIRRVGHAGPLVDRAGLLRRRYDLEPGTTYLFRPDQHVAARWRSFDVAAIARAVKRAAGRLQ
ncbi:MAG TPA: FAD-dependent oxidoreductase [Steroidobacteraceae bacterium]|nr:FAD-dependent oxidoreductase [Steroidobacteraceae bacterium]